MKKFVSFLMIVLIVFNSHPALALWNWFYKESYEAYRKNQGIINTDFREVSWGLNKDVVLKVEHYDKESQIKSAREVNLSIRDIIGWLPPTGYLTINRRFDYILEYEEENVANEKMLMTYYFFKGRLVAARYRMMNPPTSWFDQYEYIVNLLIKKYGKYDLDYKCWHSKYEAIPLTFSEGAVSHEFLSINTIWHNNNTIIYSRLYGDFYKVRLDILYIHDEYVNKADVSNM